MSTQEKVMHEDVEEDTKLESLGYQQELKRSFGLLGMIGFAFSIVTSWTALGGVLIVGVESGGPPVMYVSLPRLSYVICDLSCKINTPGFNFLLLYFTI